MKAAVALSVLCATAALAAPAPAPQDPALQTAEALPPPPAEFQPPPEPALGPEDPALSLPTAEALPEDVQPPPPPEEVPPPPPEEILPPPPPPPEEVPPPPPPEEVPPPPPTEEFPPPPPVEDAPPSPPTEVTPPAPPPAEVTTEIGIADEEFNWGSFRPDNLIFNLLFHDYCPKRGGCRVEEAQMDTTYFESSGKKDKKINIDIIGTYPDEETREMLFQAAIKVMGENVQAEKKQGGLPPIFEFKQSKAISVGIFDKDKDVKGNLHIAASYPEDPKRKNPQWCGFFTDGVASSILNILALGIPGGGILPGAFGAVTAVCNNAPFPGT